MNQLFISLPLLPVVYNNKLHEDYDEYNRFTSTELAHEGPYTASIGAIRMRLPELQDDNKEVRKLRSEGLPESWEDIEQQALRQSPRRPFRHREDSRADNTR